MRYGVNGDTHTHTHTAWHAVHFRPLSLHVGPSNRELGVRQRYGMPWEVHITAESSSAQVVGLAAFWTASSSS